MSEQNKTKIDLPTAEGWYWIKNPDFGRQVGAEEWTAIYINRMSSDFLHLKKGELVIGANPIANTFRLSKISEWHKIEYPKPPQSDWVYLPELPEKDGKYLVTVKNVRTNEIRVSLLAFMSDSAGFGLGLAGSDFEVIAWKELPAPAEIK